MKHSYILLHGLIILILNAPAAESICHSGMDVYNGVPYMNENKCVVPVGGLPDDTNAPYGLKSDDFCWYGWCRPPPCSLFCENRDGNAVQCIYSFEPDYCHTTGCWRGVSASPGLAINLMTDTYWSVPCV